MKARIAMILSAAGVLAAGTAAALVNTQVLRDDGGASVTAPDSIPTTTPAPTTSTTESTAPATAPATAVTTQVSAPSTPVAPSPSTVATTPPSTSGTAATVPGSATQQQFRLGDAATAILDTANGRLTIVTVTPHPGWEIDRAEQDDATSVDIRLRSANGEVRFEASLVRGVVVVSLRTDADATDDDPDDEDNSGSGSSGSGSGSSGSGSGSDDD